MARSTICKGARPSSQLYFQSGWKRVMVILRTSAVRTSEERYNTLFHKDTLVTLAMPKCLPSTGE